MGVFWDYFKNELRLPFLFVGGAVAMAVEGAAICLDEVRQVILTLRDQFCPACCEDVFLVRYAASRGIVRAAAETQEYWIARVRFAYLYWALGGRASCLAEALRKGFGFTHVDVVGLGGIESLTDETGGAALFDETGGTALQESETTRWAEFMVTVYLTDDAQTILEEQVISAINDVKPARSLLAGVVYIAPLWDESTGDPLDDEDTEALLTNED